MKHLTNIHDIEQTLAEHRLCLFYIKAPDCGVCKVMLDKVDSLAARFPQLCTFYTDVTEEPLIAGKFLVYSGPTVLLMLDGKEVYRSSGFIDLEELSHKLNQYTEIYGVQE
jgi:thioredoxin-like negative regulator of GroEL